MSLTAHAENVSTPAKYRTTTVPAEPAYAEHGALPDHIGPQENVVQAAPDLLWSSARYFVREPFSGIFRRFHPSSVRRWCRCSSRLEQQGNG
jgi:hypothetical protein